MNKEDKLNFLNNELVDTIKEHKRIKDAVDFCSNSLDGFPLFYSPFEQNSTFILDQMQDKIEWLQEKIQEAEAE